MTSSRTTKIGYFCLTRMQVPIGRYLASSGNVLVRVLSRNHSYFVSRTTGNVGSMVSMRTETVGNGPDIRALATVT